MNALETYRSLSQPPKSALRQISDGKLKGKTDINPQWRYEAMTQAFGLVGLGWKYEVQKLWTEPGANNEILAFAQVAVYIRDPYTKEWSDAIVGIGGSKLINQWSTRAESNDEGYKMAVTDAFSTSLKMLGVAADIYAGRWDGSKYRDCQDETPKPRTQEAGPAGGPDTPEQKKRINDLLATKYPEGNKMFSATDCKNISGLRKEKTADELIKLLHTEIKIRMQDWNDAHPPKTETLTPEEEEKAAAVFAVGKIPDPEPIF